MPAKSKAQYNLMQAVAHGATLKGAGSPSEAVAREFIAKTPKKKRSVFASEDFRGEKNGKRV